MRHWILVGLFALGLASSASAQLDTLTNAGACPVTGFAAGATSVTVATGCGATLPASNFNVAVCRVDTYPSNCKNSSGVLYPNYEVLRVTSRSTDTLTVVRAQEGTSDANHNDGAGTYWVFLLTAKTFTDINDGKLAELFIDSGALEFDAATDKLSMPTGASYPGSDPSAVQIVRTITTPPNTPPGAVNPLLGVSGTFAQSGAVNQGRIGIGVTVADDASVVNKTITGAVTDGGEIQITATAHGFANGDRINVYGVGGTTEANGVWTIEAVTANTFRLDGSTFTNTYTSGGTATNRGLYYAAHFNVSPTLDRGGLVGTGANGDDVNPLALVNSGSGKATDALWITDGVASGPAFHTLMASDSNSDYFLNLYGRAYTAGIDLSAATPDTASVPMIRIGDGHLLQAGLTVPSYLANKVINTDADGAISALDLGSSFTKNDTNTRTFSVARIKPTLNFGGSNTNTTVNLLHVNPTNTSVTGATVNLVKFANADADRYVIDANGAVTQTGPDGASTVYSWYNHQNSTTVNTTINNFIARKSSGTAASPVRTQGLDTVLRLSAGGYEDSDDTAPASMVSPHRAAIDFITGANDWTTTDHGMLLRFRTTATGGTTTNAKAFISEQGLELSTGNTAPIARGTTNPTNALTMVDGTAPAGTCTNCTTFYSSGGEGRVMDSGGNWTQLSPHDSATNEWVFFSVNTQTGKVLRVDMERLMRKLDAQLGGGFITEYAVEPGEVAANVPQQGRLVPRLLMPFAPFAAVPQGVR